MKKMSFLKALDAIYHSDIEIEDFNLISDFMKNSISVSSWKTGVMVNLMTDVINTLGEEKTAH